MSSCRNRSPIVSQNPLFSAAKKSFRRGEYTETLTVLNKLLDMQADAATYGLLAKTLACLDMKREAAHAYQLAAEAGGKDEFAYREEAMKLWYELNEFDNALAVGRPLAEKAQRDANLAFYIASCFLHKKDKDIVRVYIKVLAESDNSKHNSLAVLLLTNMPEDARDRQIMRLLLKRYPQSTFLIQSYLVTCREVNDYDGMAKYQPVLDRLLEIGDLNFLKNESPFYNLHWMADEALNKIIAHDPAIVPESHTRERRQMPHTWGERIRVGYVSSDFWTPHATMKLVRGVLEHHDREKFDITLFCYTDESRIEADEIRQKWGNIVNIRDMSIEEAAQTIRDHEIDILVDLKGQTRHSRSAILNHKAAPIHVAWLGFPGTTVNVDLDYVIGDHYVLPDESKPHYWEKFVRLPECYQPNDPIYRPKMIPLTRKDANLPEDVFVFASLNASRKISVANIELWIRILKATPDSMIWVLCTSNEAHDNIKKKLTTAGINPQRIKFTPLVSYEEHISRMGLADLGLDTFPVNGHTTTSEQLWANLPVLTKKGNHFASRVSESLLNAIGLPELVAESEDAYFQKAVELYENRELIKSYKERLVENKRIKPLFDHDRFRQHLEKAYEMMVDRARQNLEPDHIDVPVLPPRTEPFL